MWVVGFLSRNKGFLIAVVIAALLGIEVGGKGTGIFQWLISPAPVRNGAFHPVDLFGARPKGPVRLTEAQAAAVDARLAKAFAGGVPKHVRISAPHLQIFRTGDDPGCGWSGSRGECKQVPYTEPFWGAVLGAMHPATEHLLLLEARSYDPRWRDERIRLAMFVGPDERVKLAFDLRRIKGLGNFRAFTVKALGMADFPVLPAREVSGGILVVDDPGPLQSPKGGAGGAGIHIYGGAKPPENGVLSLNNEGDFLVRHKFFSGVLGKPVQGVDASAPGPAYVVDFEPRQDELRQITEASLRQALADGLGPGRAATARLSKVTARGGRGSIYGLVMDGARYLVVDVTDPADRRHYEFFWDGPDGLKPVAQVTKLAEKGRGRESLLGTYHLIAMAEAGAAERLLVFRRGERGAPIAGLWPLAAWLKAMEAVE